MIYDYLTNEEQGTASGRNPVSSINEILREGRFTRDRTKVYFFDLRYLETKSHDSGPQAVFRFADTDMKMTTKILRPHEDELTRVLKDTMPGLVQGAAESSVQAALSTVGTDDRLQGAGQHHRLLIEPDTFHVTVLFEPTLSFLARVGEILPRDIESMRDSSKILDEFVLKVYLPQLEEKVESLCHDALNGDSSHFLCLFQLLTLDVVGPEAFQPDPLSERFSPEPLLKVNLSLSCIFVQMIQNFHVGQYTIDGSDQLAMCHVANDTISSRELF